ncbi:MAG: glycosyltransferase family 4 protein [Candidatus Methanosuratincola petrocarbonis]
MTSIVDLKKSQHNRPHQFVRYLSKRHEITIISINDWWKAKQYDSSSYYSDINSFLEGVSYHYLTDRKVSPYLQEFAFKENSISIAKEQFDVHLNYNSLVAGYHFTKKIKTVFDIADDLIAMIANSPQLPSILRPIGSYVGNYYQKKNINYAKKITLTTHFLAEKNKIPHTKVEIIPNGVDIKAFQYNPNAKNDLNLNGFIIGYVGVLREWVDLEPVFASLSKLNKEIRMVIVGKEGDFQHNLDLAKKYNVSERVLFTGVVPYSQVPKYISAMDVCLIPFKTNAISSCALPLKLFEYMSCSKPVLSSNIPGVKNVAGDDVLYANNALDYCEKIRILYEDYELRKKLGDKGRLLVETQFDWEKLVKKLEKILIQISEN